MAVPGAQSSERDGRGKVSVPLAQARIKDFPIFSQGEETSAAVGSGFQYSWLRVYYAKAPRHESNNIITEEGDSLAGGDWGGGRRA